MTWCRPAPRLETSMSLTTTTCSSLAPSVDGTTLGRRLTRFSLAKASNGAGVVHRRTVDRLRKLLADDGANFFQGPSRGGRYAGRRLGGVIPAWATSYVSLDSGRRV